MAAKKIPKRKSHRIDVHSHVFPKEMLDALRERLARFQMRYIDDGKHRRVATEGGGGQPVFDEFYDPAAKVAGMDRKGLDVSIISPAPIAYRSPEIMKRLAEDGASPVATTPEAYRALIRRETAKWTQIMKAAGIAQQ